MRTAIVFASSEGIGKAIAKSLLINGNRVILFSRDINKLTSAAEELKKSAPEVYYVQGDISSEEDRNKLFKYVKDNFNGCDILINNNGGPKGGNLETLNMYDWTKAFNDFALPVFHSIQSVVPYMKQNNWGRIITIGSIASKEPINNLDISNFLRAGFTAVQKTLSTNLAKSHITVNMVLPGAILTQRSVKRIQERADNMKISFEKSLEISQSNIPMGELGKPEDVAELVSFLCSDKASYLTGLSIQVDGGMLKSIF